VLTTLILALSLGQTAPPEPLATEAEKKAFLKLIQTLPTQGEFFAAEGIEKAVPHTRVLLALTEDDIGDNIYIFLALSAGLSGEKKAREVAVKNFERIAHPSIQVNWAIMLMRDPEIQPIIVRHLKKAIDAPKGVKTLAATRDPEFEGLKKEVEAILEKKRRVSAELVKKHSIDELPVDTHGRNAIQLQATGKIYCVREEKGRGELTVTDWRTNSRKSWSIPQPAGVKEDRSRFDRPFLAVNDAGDIACQWMIGGNGDHGIAVSKADSGEFQVARDKTPLMGSLIYEDGARGWLLVRGGTLYRIGVDAKLSKLTSGNWHSDYNALDARMIAPGLLHGFFADRSIDGLQMRCGDYDFQRKLWLHERVIHCVDKFVSSANFPMVLQTDDKKIHYVWRVDPGNERSSVGGVYYQSEAHGKTIKIGNGYQFRAVASGNRVAVFMSEDAKPDKLSIRVINDGVAHPPTTLTFTRKYDYGIWCEDMELATDSERIYFFDKTERKTIYELKLADAIEP
jgi:hypothetical protein